jgi:hypothetical protein
MEIIYLKDYRIGFFLYFVQKKPDQVSDQAGGFLSDIKSPTSSCKA